jgi:hypothetical protein
MYRQLPTYNKAPRIIGVDVARFGVNDTVIYPRVGDDARSWGYKRFNGLDTMQVADKVAETVQYFMSLGKKTDALFIDGGGLGAGPIDRLRQLGYNPIEVMFGGKASQNKKYRRKGDEIWGTMRDKMKTLCLPRDEKLRAELTQREYGFTPAGTIALESKEDMKKRGGSEMSPDVADALALTFGGQIAMVTEDDNAPGTYKYDYDPLEFGEMR